VTDGINWSAHGSARDGPGADNGDVVRCAEAAWYRRYRRLAAVIFTGGGVAMIAGAAVSRSSASVPLLVIGAGWTLVGVIFIQQGRRLVTEIVVSAGAATLTSASASIDVPAADITEIGHARFDVNRMGPLTVKTTSNGRIRAVPRLEGLPEVVIELRRSNPALLCRNL
jgi:hypothetical protein